MCLEQSAARSSGFCEFFFFSSRRRHTRCLSDWSSDVCSSDLFVAEMAEQGSIALAQVLLQFFAQRIVGFFDVDGDQPIAVSGEDFGAVFGVFLERSEERSCRERV